MGRPWSDEQHIRHFEKWKKKKKPRAIFLMGRIAEFRHKGILYEFGVGYESIEPEVRKGG